MKKSALLCTAILFCSTLGFTAPALANEAAIERLLDRQLKNQQEDCLGWIDQITKINNRYFVAYTAAACGGNATASQLAELTYQNGRYSITNLNLLKSLDISIPFTYIDSMDISENGIATLNTLSYGENDSQHYPRDKHQIKVRLFDMKVLSTKFMGRAPEHTPE